MGTPGSSISAQGRSMKSVNPRQGEPLNFPGRLNSSMG
jgi:hypothetical protein